MKKYKVIKSCLVKGKRIGAQEIIELDDETAKTLLGIGRVEPAGDSAPLENRSVGLETSSSTPKKRGSKAKPKAKAKSEPEKQGDLFTDPFDEVMNEDAG